ncbi:hypothetical protein JCM10212_006578 [Sporobolomyces blumeae]
MFRSIYRLDPLSLGPVDERDHPGRAATATMTNGGINVHDLIRIGKKLFTFYRKWQKKQQQKQHQQQQQQQQQQPYSQQPYPPPQQQQQFGGGGHGQPNAWQSQSPYPPVVGQAPHGQQQPQQQQPYHPQQQHYGGGGYGSHDGPATRKKLTSSPPPFPLPHPSLALSTLTPPRPSLPTPTFALSPFSNARRIPSTFRRASALPLALVLVPSIALSSVASVAFVPRLVRSFSSTRPRDDDSSNRTPRRPEFYDPSLSFPEPSHRRPLLPALPTDSTDASPRPSSSSSQPTSTTSPSAPPPTPSTRSPRSSRGPEPRPPNLKLSIFDLLPSFLRPSIPTLLRIDDDLLVHFDPELAGQNYDMSNAQNKHYVELRNKAIREGDLMAKCFSDSQAAYQSGNGSAAHDLSIEGKRHQRLKDELNDEAARWIYDENNKVQPRGTIDLHGLYVHESIEFTERAIATARSQGLEELRVIVGKGNHSPAHVAKIKPAITSLMNREHLTARLDPRNQGVLVVQLQRQGGGMRGEEVARAIDPNEGEGGGTCLVM